MAYKIATVSAGHGGRNNFDPGAVGNGYQESRLARKITTAMAQKLNVPDCTDNVATSVNSNINNIVNNINSKNRDARAWNLHNHLNAASPGATGVEVLYYEGSDPIQKQMASNVSKAISNALGIRDRGAKPGSWAGAIRNTTGYTLLIEWCFITNGNDVRRLFANMDKAINACLACFGVSTSNNTISGANSSTWPKKAISEKVAEIVYKKGYGVNVWNGRGSWTGRRLPHGSRWKVIQPVTINGISMVQVGNNEYIDRRYTNIDDTILTINYIEGYGIAVLDNNFNDTGKRLATGTTWRAYGKQWSDKYVDWLYNVGNNQWIRRQYTQFGNGI